MNEKIVQIVSQFDTDVQKTSYIVLTDKGNMFKSYDLELWDIIVLPDFKDKQIKIKRTKLNG